MKRHNMLWAVAPAIQVAYALVFSLAYGLLGPAIAIVPASSIMLAAWLVGMRAAAVAALLAVVATTLPYVARGIDPGVALRSAVLAAAFFLVVGFVIARLRSDRVRIQRLTMFDRLTQLPHRDAFEKQLQSVAAASGPAQVALVDVF